MLVTVEGVVTSVERKEKNNKVYTEVFVAQRGEQEQVRVRLYGDHSQSYVEYEKNTFYGRLMLWRTRDGVGNMVLV